jgi:hypothetical protein
MRFIVMKRLDASRPDVHPRARRAFVRLGGTSKYRVS